MNSYGQIHPIERVHETAVERRDGLGLQWQPRPLAVAGIDRQHLVDEVEIDLERPVAVRDGRRRQARVT